MTKSPEKSEIVISPDGHTSFVGRDAVDLFRAMAVRQGLGLLALGIKPNRDWTRTRALKAASGYTGKKYARHITSIPRARADLDQWIAAAKASMPITDQRRA